MGSYLWGGGDNNLGGTRIEFLESPGSFPTRVTEGSQIY